jgi:hypothetical protein
LDVTKTEEVLAPRVGSALGRELAEPHIYRRVLKDCCSDPFGFHNQGCSRISLYEDHLAAVDDTGIEVKADVEGQFCSAIRRNGIRIGKRLFIDDAIDRCS